MLLGLVPFQLDPADRPEFLGLRKLGTDSPHGGGIVRIRRNIETTLNLENRDCGSLKTTKQALALRARTNRVHLAFRSSVITTANHICTLQPNKYKKISRLIFNNLRIITAEIQPG
jgi:hypothetical protein